MITSNYMDNTMKNRKVEASSRIIAFTCNWGGYSGIEMVGVNRLEYPANITPIRLTCLGRLNLGLIMKAFELGAGGVILLGCPAEQCNYQSGMKNAQELYKQAKAMLNLLGIDKQRLALVEVPTGDGEFTDRTLTAFAAKVEKLNSSSRHTKIKVKIHA
jgi:coenzyme F420-reducing hydrogenase delta subunit